MAFTLIVCGSGFVTAWGVAKLMGDGPAITAGLLAGGYTNSGTVGVAVSNIGQVGLDAQQVASGASLIGVAYAVTLPFRRHFHRMVPRVSRAETSPN